MKFTCYLALLCISLNSLLAYENDSLRIDPLSPYDNDDIQVLSYVTIPNCCLPIDSVSIKKDLVEFCWLQTKCGDPWHTGEGQLIYETYDSLKLFLERKGITMEHLCFDYDPELAEDCEACMCRTGYILHPYVSTEDSAAMRQLGFSQESTVLTDIVVAYHTEQVPACDCYCQCQDTVPVGTLSAGDHSLIFRTWFIWPTDPDHPVILSDTTDFLVTASGLTIPNPGERQSWEVYPNPGTETLILPEDLSGCHLRLIDMQGNTVMERTIDSHIVPIEGVNPGVFILHISRVDEFIGSQKIIIR